VVAVPQRRPPRAAHERTRSQARIREQDLWRRWTMLEFARTLPIQKEKPPVWGGRVPKALPPPLLSGAQTPPPSRRSYAARGCLPIVIMQEGRFERRPDHTPRGYVSVRGRRRGGDEGTAGVGRPAEQAVAVKGRPATEVGHGHGEARLFAPRGLAGAGEKVDDPARVAVTGVKRWVQDRDVGAEQRRREQ
jgi:hypothetical protein